MAIYLATIRKTIAAFGSIFSDIYINRYTESGGNGEILNTLKVPLRYSPADKFLTILKETVRDGSAVRLKHTLPRMSFEMLGMDYDPARKLLSMNGMCPIDVSTTAGVVQYFRQMNPVPYNYNFRLSIAAKKTEDIFQVVEQIFPHFAPSYNLTIKDVESMGITRDVPVIIESIEKEDNYDGTYEDNRIVVWHLYFKVKGYIYPPITNADVIKSVETTLYDKTKSNTTKIEKITVSVDPIDAKYEDEWTIETDIEDFTITR